MNLLNICNQIAGQDPEFYDRIAPRRSVLSRLTRGVALTALPLAIGSLLKKAYGQNNDIIVSTLNFALKLEYLEADYYAAGLAVNGLIPPADQPAINLLLTNETGHVNFIKNTIIALGGIPIAKPTFDFSGGNGNGNGPFADWDTDYDVFLALAQVFEQTGMRAYKGQAPNLMGNNEILQAALQIHSVEARHEAKLRMMRRARGAAVKPWVTLNQSGIGSSAADAAYAGEEKTKQEGKELSGMILPGAITITVNAASEAFDEPLTAAQVEAIAEPFIV